MALQKEDKLQRFLDSTPALIPLWRVIPNFRCPVIGSCLSIAEQRKLLKKSGYLAKKMSDYQVHHTLMETLIDENPVSVRTDRYIRHKYRDSIETLSRVDVGELEAAWDDAFRHGRVEGLFYIIATRPDVPGELISRAFGDVHMLGHTTMEDSFKARKALDTEIAVNKKLAARLTAEKMSGRSLSAQNRKLKKDINGLEIRLAELLKANATTVGNSTEMTELAAENASLKHQLDTMNQSVQSLIKEKTGAERERRKLEIRVFDLQATNELLSEELRELSMAGDRTDTVICPEVVSNTPCGDCSSCPKRILMVGGMTKMKPFYRDLIESKGGELVYHDGYMKQGSKQLKEMVCGADLVLCPVDCNSHNACLRLKKLCKKYNKPVKMLSGSSLNRISRALAAEQSGVVA